MGGGYNQDRMRVAEVSYMLGCITSPTVGWEVNNAILEKAAMCERAMYKADLNNFIRNLDERRKSVNNTTY